MQLHDASPMIRFVRTGALFGAVLAAAQAAPAAPVPCTACHAEVRTNAAHHQSSVACTSCHGDGTEHVKAPATPGSIIKFRDEPAATVNKACGNCHQQAHQTEANAHDRGGVSCTSCHSIHGEKKQSPLPAELGAIDRNSALCVECHQETFSQFAFNERHRLAEGALSCTSCHDPHAPRGTLQLGGFKQAMCAECHADADGPFVFEHAASRVDGCTACHDPHGSPNRHMLAHQQVGELCYSCHASVPQFHLGFSPAGPPRFDQRTVCTNCHVTIHGSNLDPLFLR